MNKLILLSLFCMFAMTTIAQNSCDSLPRIEQGDTTVCLGTPVTLNTRNYLQDSILAGFSFIGTFGGNQYYASNGVAFWEDAKIICEAAGGHLVTCNSAGENAFVGTYDPSNFYWIGYFQNFSSTSYSEPAGGWEWVTGEPTTFTGWAGTEPNQNNGEPEDYVYMNFGGIPEWNDAPSINPSYFVTLRYILEIEKPYTVVWSTGDNTNSISVTPSVTTTYYVTTSDSVRSCYDSVTVYVNDPDPALPDTISTCSQSVDLVAANGFTNYIWSTLESTSTITVSTSGTYGVGIQDSLGCLASDSVVVSIINANVSQIDTAICVGVSVVLMADSTSGNTYLWSTSETSAGIAVSPTTSTVYTVDVSDGIGTCTDTVSIMVSNPQLSIASQNASCAGNGDGNATITATNGVGSYAYLWSTTDTVSAVTGLSAGTYTVTVTDSIGCIGIDSAVIIEPNLIVLSALAVDVLCFAESNGTIDLTASGGTMPYQYSWSTGEIIEDLSNLGSGSYTVVVTDINGCMDSLSTTIAEPAGLGLSAVVTDAPCGGATGNIGAIDLTVTGGTTPYAYAWQSGPNTEDLFNLGGGSYTVVVIDTNGCINSLTVVVAQPSSLSLSSMSTDVTCFGHVDGSINLTVAGGVQPYTYSWDNGDTVEDILNLAANVYTVTVTDSNLCTSILIETVNEPSQIITSVISGADTTMEFATESYSVVQTPGSTYQWFVTNGTIASGDGTDQISVIWGAAISGQVAVFEIDINGCIGDSVYYNVFLDVIPGIDHMTLLDPITVYPNPTQHSITVAFGQTMANGKLIISSADGRIMHIQPFIRKDRIKADMSLYADGLYFLEVTNGEGGKSVMPVVLEK